MKNKKPHISEVREYFKDAETIKSCISDSVYEINTEVLGIYFDGYNYRQNTDSEERELLLWEENQGYAKILTYKTPKFEITKEHILELRNTLHKERVDYLLAEWFPEVFEVKLEVGKWYKDKEPGDNFMIFVTKAYGGMNENECVEGFGFDNFGKFRHWNEDDKAGTNGIRLATPEEVTEALKKEAVRRGYKNGNYKCLDISNRTHKVKGIYFFDKVNNRLLIGDTGDYDGKNNVVFNNGQWATVIQTKTIQQAEELLKELGHEIKIV